MSNVDWREAYTLMPEFAILDSNECRGGLEFLWRQDTPVFPGFGIAANALKERLEAAQYALANASAPWFEKQ